MISTAGTTASVVRRPVRRRGRVGAGQRRGHVLLPQHPERRRARACRRARRTSCPARPGPAGTPAARRRPGAPRSTRRPPGGRAGPAVRTPPRARSCAPARPPRSPGPRASWRAGRHRGCRARHPGGPEGRERGERVDADPGERDGARRPAAGGRVAGAPGRSRRASATGSRTPSDARRRRGRGRGGQRAGDDEHGRPRPGERADGAGLLPGGHLGRRPEPRPGRRAQRVRARTGRRPGTTVTALGGVRVTAPTASTASASSRVELGEERSRVGRRGRSAGPGRRARRPPTRR